MTINIILGVALVLAAVWQVMTVRLLRSVIGLALTQQILTIIMFSSIRLWRGFRASVARIDIRHIHKAASA